MKGNRAWRIGLILALVALLPFALLVVVVAARAWNEPPLAALALIALALLTAAALALGWWAIRRGQDDAAVPPAEEGALPAEYQRLRATHVELVGAVVEARDLTSSPTLLGHLDRSLEAAGVERLGAVSRTPFDPQRQHAVGITPTDVAALDDMVSELVSPGFALAGRIVRPPAVLVYRWQRDGHD